MNTETRARGVHSSCPGGYTHNDAEDGLSLEVDAPGVIGTKLKARSFPRQITEIKLVQKVLNTMTELGRPAFERIS